MICKGLKPPWNGYVVLIRLDQQFGSTRSGFSFLIGNCKGLKPPWNEYVVLISSLVLFDVGLAL